MPTAANTSTAKMPMRSTVRGESRNMPNTTATMSSGNTPPRAGPLSA